MVAWLVLPDRPIRFPHGAAGAVAVVGVAMLDLPALQIGQIADQDKGKESQAPNQGGYDRIECPFHNVGIVPGSGQDLVRLKTR